MTTSSNSAPAERFRPVVLIPCYQGAGRVGEVVVGARPYVDAVYVIDDGSTDGSGDEARRAGAEVWTRAANGGKGAAMRDGIAAILERAAASHVIFMDADGQHAAADLPVLIAAARAGCRFVIGSRLGDREKVPAKRFWANYIGGLVLTRMTGQPIEDGQSGFRMVSTELLRSLLPRLHSNGYAIENEMLIKAAALGASIAHVTVQTLYGDFPSHYRPFRDTWVTCWLSVWFQVFET